MSEISMSSSLNKFKIVLWVFITLLLTVLFTKAIATQPKEEQQIVLNPTSYKLVTNLPNCTNWCAARLKAEDLEIDLDYNIDNGEIEQIDNVVVRKNGRELSNIYIDRSEYEKINAAIIKGIE